jgi:TonB-linked SusC/RagA family outer membrane protein
MRKIALLCSALLLCCMLTFAQQKTVSGRVTDQKGDPVPFATVQIKGTKGAVVADANGTFSLKVKSSSDALVITAQGFAKKEVPIGESSVFSVSLAASSNALEEVIVTSAFNTKRSGRSTSNNAQVVSADKLNTIRETNINNALAGKVSGLQVQSQSIAALGRDTKVRLRGESSLDGNGNAIFVVDGTILPSSGDINPDDIEDVTVLQGPNAAALFGSQGAYGAIIITTKKAKRGAPGMGIEANIGVTVDKVSTLPRYQNSYAGGGAANLAKFTWLPGMPDEWKTLDGKYYPDYSDDASWGPRMAGQEYIPWYAWYPGTKYTGKTASLVAQPDNAKQYFNTGITANNNIAFSKAGDNYSTRISYGNITVKGLVPYSQLRKNTLTMNSSLNLNSHFTVSANINYLNQLVNGELGDGYANQSTGSFNSWFHRDLDMKIMKELQDLRSPDGTLATWNHLNPDSWDPSAPVKFYGSNYWYNFYTWQKLHDDQTRRDRLFGDVSLNYKVYNDLQIKFTYRKQQLTTNFDDKTYNSLELSGNQTGVKNGYATGQTFSNTENFEALISYNKKIRDFSITANAGATVTQLHYKELYGATSNGLNVPDFFALNNSKNPVVYTNGSNPEGYRENSKSRAAFVTGTIGWRNFLFGDFTLRKDFYSSEPVGSNGILVKSFGGSFVFSDLIQKSLPFLSYGKLRGSWGEIPNPLKTYQLGFNYGVGANQWNGNFLMGTPDGLVDPSVHGAVTTQRELGLELRFLKSRVGFSVTYWDGKNKDIPLNVSINGASGFTSKLINAGEVDKTGVDVQLNARPIEFKDFQWNLSATWGRLIKNKVVALAPGLDRITVSSGAFAGSYASYLVNSVGQPSDQLFGAGIQKIGGQPVLNTDGTFVRIADQNFGTALPDYTGGLQNTFSYKNFMLSINIDFSYGGKFSSLSQVWGDYSGLTARTATTNDKGNPIRDAVNNGGGLHVKGVDASAHAVDYYVDAYTYFHQFVNSGITENSIYDLTFVKLREISLGYKIDVAKLGLQKVFTNASLSLVSRNLLLIYAKTKDFDPSEISGTYGEDGQLPGTRSIGVNLKLGF